MGMKAGKKGKRRARKLKGLRADTDHELARARAAIDLLPPEQADAFSGMFDAIDQLREAAASGEVTPQELFERFGEGSTEADSEE